MRVSIVTRPGQLRKLDLFIRKSIIDHMDDVMSRAIPSIRNSTKVFLKRAILESPEMSTLADQTSSLHGEIGNPQIAQYIEQAADYWVDTVRIIQRKTRFTAQGLSGGFLMQAIPSSYNEALKSAFSKYISVNAQGEATDVPWLQWFLLEGTNPVVENYYYTTNVPAHVLEAYSRTRQGLMRPSFGGFYRLPVSVTGTQGDNFVTRAIDRIELELMALIEIVIKRLW